MGGKKIHFLHIGKTGGSAVKSVLENYTSGAGYQLIIHNHRPAIDKIPPGEKIIFFLREPISRFISGFYSRQRKGRPRYNVEWTEVERKVFGVFSTPNELAGALAAGASSELFPIAVLALQNIQHLKKYDFWYISHNYFQTRMDDILYVGFQENLDECFEELGSILGLPKHERLPIDDVTAHRNLIGLDRHISEAGVKALNSWYASDIDFIAECKKLTFKSEIRN